MLKSIAAVLMLVIGILNVAHTADEEVDLAWGQLSSVSQHDSSRPDASPSAHPVAHQCHMGHCQFALHSVAVVAAPQTSEYLVVIDVQADLSDLDSSLIRPPRA